MVTSIFELDSVGEGLDLILAWLGVAGDTIDNNKGSILSSMVVSRQ